MNKKEIRKKQLIKLKEFANTKQKDQEDHLLTKLFFNQVDLHNVKTVGITLSLPYEINTKYLITKLWNLDITTYVPTTNLDKTMNFYKYDEDTKLITSYFGIQEIDKPQESNNNLDLIIVPGLAFNINNHQRIGFGGGYYDRFLNKYPSRTVSLANQIMIFKDNKWRVEPTDISIDYIIDRN